MLDDFRGCKGEDLGIISLDGKFLVFQYGDCKIIGFVDLILVYVEENFENFLFLNGLEKEVVQWVFYI